jgi:hypothetical protein
MRFRAESTAVIPGLEIKQSAIGVPYDADPTRLPGPPWYASAAGSRARGLGAGYSAGRSACPLPRLSPHYIWHRVPAGTRCRSVTLTLTKPRCALCLAGNRRGPRAQCSDRSRIADFRATVRGYLPLFARSNLACATAGSAAIFHCRHTRHRSAEQSLGTAFPMLQNGWREPGKLLASVSAVSDRNGVRQRSEDGRSVSWPTDSCWLSRAPIPRAVGSNLRRDDGCPVHTCG